MFTSKVDWSFVPAFPDGKGAKDGLLAAHASLVSMRDDVVPGGLENAMHRTAAEIEATMERFAPWTDRTGDARSGLWAAAGKEGDLYFVSMGHDPGLEYPKYLETMQNGRFAIVGPTQEIYSRRTPEIIEGDIRAAMEGRGAKFRHRETGRFV